jgi:hypothetical protein
MRSSKLLALIAIGLAFGLSSCAAVEAERQAQVEKQQETAHRMDVAHIWVTTEAPAAGKPFTELGPLTYTEPFTPDAIEEDKITARLKKMAMDKWPDDIDAIVDENTAVSSDGSQFTVSAKAIKYDSSVDREAMHHMNEGLVASPSNNQ